MLATIEALKDVLYYIIAIAAAKVEWSLVPIETYRDISCIGSESQAVDF